MRDIFDPNELRQYVNALAYNKYQRIKDRLLKREENNQNEYKKQFSDPEWDSDSGILPNGQEFRYKGFDSPEVSHKNPGEWKKPIEQLAWMNEWKKEQAQQYVGWQRQALENDMAYRQSEQFKIDREKALQENPNDPYYSRDSLNKVVANTYGKDEIGRDMTAFDIWGAGEMARDKTQELMDSEKYKFGSGRLTGEKGHYGRWLVENDPLKENYISSGYAVPTTADDAERYNKDVGLMAYARQNKLGLYDKPTTAKVMDAMYETSYARRKNPGDENVQLVDDEIKYDNMSEGERFWEDVKDMPKEAAKQFTRAFYDLADTVVEGTGNIIARGLQLVGLKEAAKAADKWDLGTEQEKAKDLDNLYGRSSVHTERVYEGIGKEVDELFNNVKNAEFKKAGMNIVNAIGLALTNPSSAAGSLGYLASALLGLGEKATIKGLQLTAKLMGTESKIANIAVRENEIAKAASRGQISKETAIDTIAKIEEGMSKTDKVKLLMVQNADLLGLSAK